MTKVQVRPNTPVYKDTNFRNVVKGEKPVNREAEDRKNRAIILL